MNVFMTFQDYIASKNYTYKNEAQLTYLIGKAIFKSELLNTPVGGLEISRGTGSYLPVFSIKALSIILDEFKSELNYLGV